MVYKYAAIEVASLRMCIESAGEPGLRLDSWTFVVHLYTYREEGSEGIHIKDLPYDDPIA